MKLEHIAIAPSLPPVSSTLLSGTQPSITVDDEGRGSAPNSEY